MASDPPSLGTRIRRARERARMSQDELALAVGASVRAVGDWENDRRKPRNRLGALEHVLGVSFGDPADRSPPPATPDGLRAAIYDELPPDRARRVAELVEAELAGEPLPAPRPSRERPPKAG